MTAHYPDDALCAQVGGELWFLKGWYAAKRICRECPVAAECLRVAMSLEENPHGIWGGTTESERRKMRRKAA